MKKTMAVLMLVVLVSSNIFGHSLMNVMAEEPAHPELHCYYTSIQIQPGDSLWTIAQKYSVDTDYNIAEYIEKLKQMNGLQEDVIHAGQHLTVMYMAAVE